jgi:hypothetical protein
MTCSKPLDAILRACDPELFACFSPLLPCFTSKCH